MANTPDELIRAVVDGETMRWTSAKYEVDILQDDGFTRVAVREHSGRTGVPNPELCGEKNILWPEYAQIRGITQAARASVAMAFLVETGAISLEIVKTWHALQSARARKRN